MPEYSLEQLPKAMSLDQARTLIRENFKLIIDDHDPLMVSVLLHQGFMADYNKMISHHEKWVIDQIATSTAETSSQIKSIVETLSDEVLKGSLANVLASVSEKAKLSEELFQKSLSVKRSLFVFTLLNWAAVAALFLIFK